MTLFTEKRFSKYKPSLVLSFFYSTFCMTDYYDALFTLELFT